ncbi:MAG: hypothetical protein LV480_07885 [Methylacidiphilales bacterium]|nr:hypothetical protein [Candidatus Methylacidiphilales bacterium]
MKADEKRIFDRINKINKIGIFWWPGLLVVRVRERGIARAQEVAGKFINQWTTSD